jgi:type I restriction enzyme M protein
VVLKKSKRDNSTLFIDASAEFVRGGNKNKLSETNRKRILNAYIDRKDIAHFARLVPNSEIAANVITLPSAAMWNRKTPARKWTLNNSTPHSEIVIRQTAPHGIDEIVADLRRRTMNKVEELIQEMCPME